MIIANSTLAATKSLQSTYPPASPYPTSVANTTISHLVNPLINFVIIGFGVAALATIILAGFNFITAAGDKGKIQQATQMLTYAIIGLVVIAAAFLLTNIISSTVGGGFKLLPI